MRLVLFSPRHRRSLCGDDLCVRSALGYVPAEVTECLRPAPLAARL